MENTQSETSRSYSISKLDAARRQLDTAIKLFFSDLDSVSIHTLSCASHEILFQIGREKKVSSIIKEGFKSYIKEEKWDFVMNKMNEAKNFFKHAGRDASKEQTFNPQQTELWIWDACLMFQQLSGEMTDYMICFHSWYMLIHRETIKNQAIRSGLENASSLLEKPKREFLQIALEGLQRRLH